MNSSIQRVRGREAGLRKSTEHRTERTCCSVSLLLMAIPRMERVLVRLTQAAINEVAESFMEG